MVALALLTGLTVLFIHDPAKSSLFPPCLFHALTGLHCPGCGSLRATHELLHGRLLSALRHNAFWVLLLPLVFYAVLSETLRAVRVGWLGPMGG